MSDEVKRGIENAFCWAASIAQESFSAIGIEWTRPCVLFKPRVFLDGNQWCALYGENLQDGVAGFGDSPALAMADFDSVWGQALKGGE